MKINKSHFLNILISRNQKKQIQAISLYFLERGGGRRERETKREREKVYARISIH